MGGAVCLRGGSIPAGSIRMTTWGFELSSVNLVRLGGIEPRIDKRRPPRWLFRLLRGFELTGDSELWIHPELIR